MEPVTTAIIAALAVGAASGVTDAAQKAIMDGYEGLTDWFPLNPDKPMAKIVVEK